MQSMPKLRSERAELLYAAIGTTAEIPRAVIILREIEGCDYETIGGILQINPGTVRSRLHRGRMQLREKTAPSVQKDSSAP